jgi:hypothetical protein
VKKKEIRRLKKEQKTRCSIFDVGLKKTLWNSVLKIKPCHFGRSICLWAGQ